MMRIDYIMRVRQQRNQGSGKGAFRQVGKGLQDSPGEVAERGNELLADAVLMRQKILLRAQMPIEVNLVFERERSGEINGGF